jgi:hypothetical protein
MLLWWIEIAMYGKETSDFVREKVRKIQYRILRESAVDRSPTDLSFFAMGTVYIMIGLFQRL